MITFSERVTNGMPVVTITFHVDEIESFDVEALRARWNQMYRDHRVFALELDLSQIGVLSGMTLLPSFVPIAKATRELSKEQVFLTGIAIPWLASVLIEAGKEAYPPVRPIVQGETPLDMQLEVEKVIWDPKYKNADGTWNFYVEE